MFDSGMNNTGKKRGRKKAYTTEDLESVVRLFLSEKKYYNKLTATMLADFAKEKMGVAYKDIAYHHFTRNADIKKRIEDFNKINSSIELKGKVDEIGAVKFYVDKFLEKTKGNIEAQRPILKAFNAKYESTCRSLIKLDSKVKSLEKEIDIIKKEQESTEKTLKLKNKELSKENRELKTKIADLNRIERFLNGLTMYEYLTSKGLVDSIDENNLKLLLKNAGLLKESDCIEMDDAKEYWNQSNEKEELNPEEFFGDYDVVYKDEDIQSEKVIPINLKNEAISFFENI